MINGQKVIDADAHVREPGDMLLNYLEPRFLERAPVFDDRGTGNYVYGGESVPGQPSTNIGSGALESLRANYGEYMEAGWDADSQLKAMDRFGIEMAFLYPTRGLSLWTFTKLDAELAAALATCYNNWVYDFSQKDPTRLMPVGGLDLRDPKAAVAEVKRVAGMGFRAVWARPNPFNGRFLNSPDYEDLWSTCEALGVSFAVHEGSPTPLPATGKDRFESYFARHATSHPMEQMMAFLALVDSGVFDRHPHLRVSFLESGAGWVPFWLFRLDTEYKHRVREVADKVKMRPSEYFLRQCYVSCEPDEPYLGKVIDFIGEDNLLFASDYPHADHGPEIMDELVLLGGELSQLAFRKLLWDNPRAYYALD